MIQLRVKELLVQKGMKPTPFSLKKFGIPRVAAYKMIHAKAKTISFEHLEWLCIGLRCTPKEILGVYSPASLPIPEDTPLYAWVNEPILQPMAKLRELTPAQIAKVSAFMKDLTEEG